MVDSDDSFVVDDIILENKKYGCKEFINKPVFMMWDGIGFFGLDSYKLKRVRGKKPGWCDNYKNPKRFLQTLIIMGIVLYIFFNEAGKLESIESSELTYKKMSNYTF